MKYMLLVATDDYRIDEDGMPAGCEGWAEEMAERGVLGPNGILRPPVEAKTVQVRAGALNVTDGPFAESKELIAGFAVIDCDTIEEAIEIASRHPVAAYGSVEVRSLWEQPAG